MLKTSSESSLSSDDAGLVITDVRSLRNTNDQRQSSGHSYQRKQDQASNRQQVNSVNAMASQHRQESWIGPGKFDRTFDIQRNVVPRSDLNQNPQASSPSHSSTVRSKNGHSSTSERRRKKKSAPRYLEPLDPVPSTSFRNQHVFIDDVDDANSGAFDVDCSPYNDGSLNNTDDTKGMLAGSNNDGSHAHVQAGRSRRTVSPSPFKFKLNLKKRGQDEWFINNASQDSWDDSDNYANRMNAGATPAFDDRPTCDVRYGEEEPHCSWQNVDGSIIQGSMGELHLNERFVTVIDGSTAANLKPCLRKNAGNAAEEMRHSRNVSWDDENNEFDTAVDYREEVEKCNDDERDNGDRNVHDDIQENTEKCSISSHQAISISNHSHVENGRCPIKTPVNSIEETTSLESDVEDDDAVIEGPPSSSASEESSASQNVASKFNMMDGIKAAVNIKGLTTFHSIMGTAYHFVNRTFAPATIIAPVVNPNVERNPNPNHITLILILTLPRTIKHNHDHLHSNCL